MALGPALGTAVPCSLCSSPLCFALYSYTLCSNVLFRSSENNGAVSAGLQTHSCRLCGTKHIGHCHCTVQARVHVDQPSCASQSSQSSPALSASRVCVVCSATSARAQRQSPRGCPDGCLHPSTAGSRRILVHCVSALPVAGTSGSRLPARRQVASRGRHAGTCNAPLTLHPAGEPLARFGIPQQPAISRDKVDLLPVQGLVVTDRL
jgi:hypothetical protein